MLHRLLLLAFIMAWFGCGKKTASTPPVAGEAAAASEGNSGAGAGDQATLVATLNDLTQTVRKYAAERQRAPKSLDELVTDGYLTGIPQAPAGKKFALGKNLQVVVISQ
jgi:hypothetical protein